MDVSITGAFIAGILSFLSPCVLPLVPPYLCYVGGASIKELSSAPVNHPVVRRVVLASVVFVLGFTTVFVALGATASVVGQTIAEHFDILGQIAGGLIILLGLNFLGILKISTLMRDARFHDVGKPASLPGAYVIGLAFAFGWTPCVGPVLATILFVAGSEESVSRGMVLLGVYSLGIGLPFIVAACAIAPFTQVMKRFTAQMAIIEKIIGILLIITGILFMTGSVNEIGNWLLQTFPSLGKIG